MLIKKGYKNAIINKRDKNFKKSLIIIKLLYKNGFLIYIKNYIIIKKA